MWKDPIVEETRERREQYAASLHHDLDAIFADIRKRQANRAQTPVSLAARKPSSDSDAASALDQSILNSRRTEGPDWDRISREIISAKWLVWHGKGRKALPRLQAVNEELEKWPNQEHTALWWNVHKVYCYIRSHTRFLVNRGALPEGITHQQQHRRVGGQPSRERKDG